MENRFRKPRAKPSHGIPGAGDGGNIPPVDHRWKPGQSGNPKGRPATGATLREWIDVFAAQELTEAQLRRIARDQSLPWPKRAAAERILRTLEAGDMADMEPLLRGDKNLEELRAAGINTEIVKKVKVKRRTLNDGTEVVERELELHDRAGEDFDRICDRTDGRPTQRVNMDATHKVELDPLSSCTPPHPRRINTGHGTHANAFLPPRRPSESSEPANARQRCGESQKHRLRKTVHTGMRSRRYCFSGRFRAPGCK